jgi:Spy/CpxP family protein refolding chaperone
VKEQLIVSMAAAAWLVCVDVAGAQTAGTQPTAPSDTGPPVLSPQEVDLLRKDIRSQKKQLIAQNLKLTDKEATKFWPIYDQYTAELVKINDAKYAAIKDYATNYDTLTDEKALSLTNQILGVDQSVAQLRQKYVPIASKVISGKKTALFFQLDRRLTALIDLQLAAAIPMVQP